MAFRTTPIKSTMAPAITAQMPSTASRGIDGASSGCDQLIRVRSVSPATRSILNSSSPGRMAGSTPRHPAATHAMPMRIEQAAMGMQAGTDNKFAILINRRTVAGARPR